MPARPLHLSYGDGMRLIAVVGVIGVHVAGVEVMRYGRLDPFSWWSANVLDSLCRWAVPVFIMLSGALILDSHRTESTVAFYRKRLARIGIPLLAWAAFYFFWTGAFYGEQVDRAFVLTALLDGLTYNHLYFLFLILGLYAVTPLLRIYVTRASHPIQWIVALAGLALVSHGFPQNMIPMNAGTRFLPFIGYFLVGVLLRDVPLRRSLTVAALLGFLAATALIAIGTGHRFATWGPSDWRALTLYDTLGAVVILQSLSMFVVLRACFTEREAASPRRAHPTQLLAPLAFGIYLAHRAVHDLLHACISTHLPQDLLLAMPVQMLLVFLISAAVVALIRQVPYLRAVVG